MMYNFFQRKTFCLLGIALVLSFGCGPRPPADSPKTVAFSVLVTKDGEPLAEANVFFVPDSHPGSVVCTGLTDSNGVAKMNTDYRSFKLKGAPVGNNKVYVVKEVDALHTKTQEERSAMGYAEGQKYDAERQQRRAAMPLIVPKSLTSETTSELTVEVAAGAEQLIIEVDEYK